MRGRGRDGERGPGCIGRQSDERLRRRARAAPGVPRRQPRRHLLQIDEHDRRCRVLPGGAGRIPHGLRLLWHRRATHGTTDYTTVQRGPGDGQRHRGGPAQAGHHLPDRRGPGSWSRRRPATSTGASSSPCSGSVKNTDMGTAHFKAFAAADFFFDGSDRGTGIYTQGPPQFIGGTNADTGNSGGFAEVPGATAWSRYQALEYGSGPDRCGARSRAPRRARDPTFDNTVVGEQVDNAGRRRVGPVRHGRRAREQRDRDLLARRPQRRSVGAPDQSTERGRAQGRADQLHRRRLRHQRRAICGQDDPLFDHRRERGLRRRDRRLRWQRGHHRSGHQRGCRYRRRVPGLQQRRRPRGRRAAGLRAGDLRRQRPAGVHREGLRRPARWQRRRGQAAGHQRQLQRGVDRHRSDDAPRPAAAAPARPRWTRRRPRRRRR